MRLAVRRYHGSFVITPMWGNCVDASSGPPPPHSTAAGPRSMAVIAASSRLRNSAPLGIPVVPEVKTITTGRSRVGLEAGGGTTGLGELVSTTAGSTRVVSACCSASVNFGFTPAVMAPSFAAAPYAIR